HENSHAVAEIEQFRSGRVVAGADGIDPHLFQDLDLPLQRPRIDRCAERPQIVVITDTFDPHELAVKKKTFLRGEFDRANPEDRFVAVHRLAVLLNDGYCDVEIWLLQTP